MKTVLQKQRVLTGFTIVELLIVIVVIGILAAISVVAYNGITQSAKNAQTQQAAAQWLKALQLYRAEKGSWPGFNTCLGQGYKYGISGNDTSGGAQCRLDAGQTNGFVSLSSFDSAMAAYLSGQPTPAMVTGIWASGTWKRGLSYLLGSGNVRRIDAIYAGNVDPCPSIGVPTADRTFLTNNTTACHYTIGNASDD